MDEQKWTKQYLDFRESVKKTTTQMASEKVASTVATF